MTPEQQATIDAPLKALIELTQAIAAPHLIAVYGDAQHLTEETANVLFQALVGSFDDPLAVLKVATMNVGYFLRLSAADGADCVAMFSEVGQWLQDGVDAAQRERAQVKRFDA